MLRERSVLTYYVTQDRQKTRFQFSNYLGALKIFFTICTLEIMLYVR